MRAVVIDGFGGPAVLRVAEVSPPVVGRGQVLVRVAAAGVNPVDWKVRDGQLKNFIAFAFPTILGSEIAGTIEALGPGVTGFARGDVVHGMVGVYGGFADYVVIDAHRLAKKPASLSLVEAAALPMAVATAVTALDAGAVGTGTRVLLHAAAGGVGCIALQLARSRGAEVTAVGSLGNLDFLRELGAQHVIDRANTYESVIGDFDVVLDGYGPEAQARSWKLLRKGGVMVSIVAPPDEATATAHSLRATMIVANPVGTLLSNVDRLIEKGEVKVHVSRTYPLEKAAEALAEVERGRVRGKVALLF
jgi:NADPH:quinone reductase-like Zn-dependent oxidoreductase